jgi:two-component system sensor histidine kinase YesM
VNEVYIEKLKQQQVQLKLLQSQINPHFLYNCLNMNYQMAKSGNVEGASEMSLYLGRYFRYATKSNKDIVTMKEELENVETYLKIQKIQYEDKFEYEFRVPEHLANV